MRVSWQWRMAGVLVLGCWMAGGTRAADESNVVVVSASRIPLPADRVGSSVTVVGESAINAWQSMTVPDVLDMVPGLHVARNGGVGRVAPVYIRGADSQQTVVMINGIEVNDPMGFGRGADMGGLDVSAIERIEVIRGPQSSVYGADAMAGVINIITRKGTGAPQTRVTLEAGSYETFRQTLDFSGRSGGFHYALNANYLETAGFSVADEADGHSEADGYRATTLSARFGHDADERVVLDGFVQYVDEAMDLDSSSHRGLEDTLDDTQQRRSWLGGGSAVISLLDAQWRQRVSAGMTSHERTYDNPGSHSVFEADLYETGWQHDWVYSDRQVLSAGVDFQSESGRSVSEGEYAGTFGKETAEMTGLFVEENLGLTEWWHTVLSVRWDDHDRFGEEFTWRAATSVSVPGDVRLHGSYGTGFKAPSLYQLYSPYGSALLQPETVKGWDAGIETAWFEKTVTFGATWFQNRYRDLIDFDYATWLYSNVAQAETRGLETVLAWNPHERFGLSMTWTSLRTEDTDGVRLPRRPEDRVTADVRIRPMTDLSVTLSARHVGERPDEDFATGQTVPLDAYTVVNLAAAYDYSKAIQVFGRIENLFDEHYQELLGFGTAGLSGYGGVACRF